MGQPTGADAILTPITEAAIFLTVRTVDGRRGRRVRDVLADVSGLRRSVGFRLPEGDLTCVVGVGAARLGRACSARRARPACIPSPGSPVPGTSRPRRRAICCSTSAPTGSTSASSSRNG